MTATPKTIQIFLPGGDPRGIRVAEITTRIVQVIEVPRSLLQDFLRMPEGEEDGTFESLSTICASPRALQQLFDARSLRPDSPETQGHGGERFPP